MVVPILAIYITAYGDLLHLAFPITPYGYSRITAYDYNPGSLWQSP
jgi:hypothetical protein